MTPYAVLLVHCDDTEEVIRRRFHALSKVLHPDKGGNSPPRWHSAVEAYNILKHDRLRFQWHRRQKLLSGLCTKCDGCGTVYGRGSTVELCKACNGEGRIVG